MKQATVPGRTRGRICLGRGFRALLAAALPLLFGSMTVVAQEPAFKVLAFYSTDVEPDHVHTANDALAFFRGLGAKNNFTFDATTDWAKLNENDLKPYRLILWLNNFPQTPEQRAAFEKYMEHGGGSAGLYAVRHHGKTTKWVRILDFTGVCKFYSNVWAPLAVQWTVDERPHPVAQADLSG